MICYFESLSTTKKTRICYLGGILFPWASRGFGSEDGPGVWLTLGEIVRRGVWSPEDIQQEENVSQAVQEQICKLLFCGVW